MHVARATSAYEDPFLAKGSDLFRLKVRLIMHWLNTFLDSLGSYLESVSMLRLSIYQHSH